ncbi:MAG: SRPBCC family protein [Mesorhizobium sp.]|nr:MAG: SRPBCC family protein [Mesorhizobium sp.]
MNQMKNIEAYGELTEPATFTIQRLLPGPIERVWAYLTESDLRRQWMAAGQMEMKAGTSFEFVWRNDELTDPPGQRPAGFPEEHRMEGRITELDPPYNLAITWGNTGGVSFLLEARGSDVLLTIVHRRLPERAIQLNITAGWHMHLDLLAARLAGKTPTSFWDGWGRLREEYDRRLPA